MSGVTVDSEKPSGAWRMWCRPRTGTSIALCRFGLKSSKARVIAIGQQIIGMIESSTDRDWIGAHLAARQKYRATAFGQLRQHQRPHLRHHNRPQGRDLQPGRHPALARRRLHHGTRRRPEFRTGRFGHVHRERLGSALLRSDPIRSHRQDQGSLLLHDHTGLTINLTASRNVPKFHQSGFPNRQPTAAQSNGLLARRPANAPGSAHSQPNQRRST